MPSATQMCDFPTPGGPNINTASALRIHAPVASVSMRERPMAGWKAKSKFSRVWPEGRLESRSEVRILRSSRRSISTPRSLSRKACAGVSSRTASASASSSISPAWRRPRATSRSRVASISSRGRLALIAPSPPLRHRDPGTALPRASRRAPAGAGPCGPEAEARQPAPCSRPRSGRPSPTAALPCPRGGQSPHSP